MSTVLHSSNAKLVPPKVGAVGWDWESESKLQSEAKSEAKAESEPECKRRRWEVKDMDDTPPWELKDFDDLELSDFTMYDDDPLPISFRTKDGVYMNQAMIDEQKAWAEYLEQGSKLPPPSPWDAVPPPDNLPLVGGIRSYTITHEDRPRFIHYCKLSLNKYNDENQGANFVFHELVKATSPVSCPLYYITFLAKDASNNNNNNADVSTFQAEVSDKLTPSPLEAKVILCKMKPN